MQRETYCEYCKEKMAVANCEVCGSAVCGDHKLENGCKVCNGGKRTLK